MGNRKGVFAQVSVFQPAVLWIIKEEGGLHDDPADHGGITNMGIALAEHPEMTADDIRHLSIAQAIDIYRAQYWNAICGNLLPDYAAWVALDCAVNQGAGEARLLLQKAAGIAQDGVIGPASIAAIHGADPEGFLASFTAARDVRYSRSPKWQLYGDGWVRRATLAAIKAAHWIP